MFCPNCGHKVEPDQKFCDNCGWALKKKNTEDTKEQKDDDSVRSLSEIENELNEEDPIVKPTTETKPHLEQAPAQQQEYGSFDHPERKTTRPDPEPEMKTFERKESTRPSSFEKSNSNAPLDDRTQVYSKNDFNPISQKPYKNNPEQAQEKPYSKPFVDPIKDPIKDPFAPTESEKRAAEAKRQAEAVDPNDGFIHNMIKFAKNNAYVSIFAVIIVAILLVVKRNYGYIALAVVLIAWFLFSQLRHGNELGANKALKKETSLKKNSDSDEDTPDKTETYAAPKQKKEHHKTAADRLKPNHKTTTQKIIIVSSVIGFIASISGPFLDGLSLSSTIAGAANYTANNLGSQPTWFTNGFSAIRLICFLSPVIALLAGCFRSRGSIRLTRIFTFLPTVLYAALYGALSAGLVNSSAITGQVVANASRSFGASFYVLLITSVVSLVMAYTLRPKIK